MSAGAETTDLTPLFAALADKTRLRLLNLIAAREMCVCYLVEVLQLSQPKISRHLAYLRKTGVVASRREGKWIHYRMQPFEGTPMASILETVLRSVKADAEMQSDLERLDRACADNSPCTSVANLDSITDNQIQ